MSTDVAEADLEEAEEKELERAATQRERAGESRRLRGKPPEEQRPPPPELWRCSVCPVRLIERDKEGHKARHGAAGKDCFFVLAASADAPNAAQLRHERNVADAKERAAQIKPPPRLVRPIERPAPPPQPIKEDPVENGVEDADWLRVSEAAVILGCSAQNTPRAAIKRKVRRKKGPDGKWRYSRADLKAAPPLDAARQASALKRGQGKPKAEAAAEAVASRIKPAQRKPARAIAGDVPRQVRLLVECALEGLITHEDAITKLAPLVGAA